MHIILLGAPGSGKGTQSKFIAKKYGIQIISVGDILRAEIKIQSIIGNKIKSLMNRGKLVTDEIVISLLKKCILEKVNKNGFLLDGFPRTIIQAKSIEKLDIKINYVLEFFLPDQLITQRLIGRRIHEASGRIYHIIFNPPKIEGKDDISGEKLIIRHDDEETVILQRIKEYHKITKPIISFYKKEAKLGNVIYHKIDATMQIKKIEMELMSIIN